MSSIRAVTGVLICALGFACSGGTRPGTAAGVQAAVAVAEPKLPASLTCDGGTFAKIRLKNTNARSYTASGSTCTLTDQAKGVIWVATGEGYAFAGADKKLLFKDDQGRQFGHTCWVSSGTIDGVLQTSLVLFGPADSRSITACCGEACAETEVQ